MQIISVKCKLQVPVELRNEIDRTVQGFADACNQIYETAKRRELLEYNQASPQGI